MQTFKDVDRTSYNMVAVKWDAHSEQMSGHFTPRLLELAGVGAGQRVIEVCCGTGVVSRVAAQAVGGTGSVLATDITPGMIQVARDSASRQGLNNVEFQVMDCEALEVADASFDAGLALYPHFGDHRRALAEMLRVLKPGGRLAIGVGDRPRKPGDAVPPTPLAMRILEDVVQRYQPEDPGGHPPSWAGDEPLVGVAAALHEAGFIDVVTDTDTHQVQLGSPEEAWEIWSMTASGVRHRLSLLPPEQRGAVRHDFLATFTPLADAETLIRTSGTIFVAGRKRSP